MVTYIGALISAMVMVFSQFQKYCCTKFELKFPHLQASLFICWTMMLLLFEALSWFFTST